MDRLAERRVSGAIIAASAMAFLGLFAIAGSAFETPDEAKYVGLGLNLLAGHGLTTDLGEQFASHPPLWAVALALPRALLSLDSLAIGHLLDAIAGATVIVLAAALTWRVRPAAAAVTAVALLATSYLASLARTAGIDLPAAVWALGYLLVAARSIERGSVRLGLVAGVLFGIGFLTKETVLPFAPIPFLVALLGPARGERIARVGAAALLAATVTCGWWFLLYASLTGSVYRLGGPAWLLGPLAVIDGLVITAGLVGSRLPTPAVVRRRLEHFSERSVARLRAAGALTGIGVWLLAQLVVYARAPALAGLPIVRGSQLVDDLRVYLPQLGLGLGFSVAGSALALETVRRNQAARELAGAAVAQLPLIILVLGIGETPRHYIATLALLTGLGALGWVSAATEALRRRDWRVLGGAVIVAGAIASPQLAKVPVSARMVVAALVVGAIVALAGGVGIVAWRRWAAIRAVARPATRRVADGQPVAGTIALVLVFLAGTGVATATAVHAAGASPAGVAEARAIDGVGGWLRANLPDGATIMVGPRLAYELALAVHGQLHVVREVPTSASLDPASPLGLASGKQAVDPITLDTALRNVDFVNAYQAAALTARIQAVRPAVWVEAAYVSSAAPESPVLAMFDAAAGVVRLKSWAYDYGTQRLLVVAYQIDAEAFAPRAGVIYASPDGIDVVARLLGSVGDSAAARRLLGAITPVPAGLDADASLASLRAVAGP